MSNLYLSPNMNLVVPVAGVDPGPDWANNLNASLTILDAHNHSPGSGVPITPTGININADLPFNNSYNAISMRSLRFFPNLSPLSLGTDLGCLYEAGVDLYYNDGNGNQIRITQSGSVSGSAGTITGLPSGTASAAYVSGSGTFTFLQATSTAANLDAGSIAVRYPGSYPTPSGNYIQLQAPSSLASGYSLTLPAIPGADNTFLTINTDGRIVSAIAVDNSTLEISSNNVHVKDAGITQAKLALRVTGSTVGAGGVAITGSSGNFNTNSTSFVQVTNMSCVITTLGSPVQITLNSDGSGNSAQLFANGGSTGLEISLLIQVLRDGSQIGNYKLTAPTNLFNATPSSAFSFIDDVAAGSYTYTIKAAANNASGTVGIQWSKLAAYEL